MILDFLEANPNGLSVSELQKLMTRKIGEDKDYNVTTIRVRLCKMVDAGEIHACDRLKNPETSRIHLRYKLGPGESHTLKFGTGIYSRRLNDILNNREAAKKALQELGGEATSIQVSEHLGMPLLTVSLVLSKMPEGVHISAYTLNTRKELIPVYKLGEGEDANKDDYRKRKFMKRNRVPFGEVGYKPKPATVKLPEKPRSWMDI
jgi:uncharacterized membrane protein YkoI